MDPRPKPAEDYDSLPGEHVTIDQIVAMNLRYWRIAAELKQHELGERAGISKANMSALERSADGERNPRRFDAQTIVTLAVALGLPVSALFLPPPDDGISKRYLFDAAGACKDMGDLVNHVLSDPPAPDDEHGAPLMALYAERYFGAISRYTELSPDEVDSWIGDLANAVRRRDAADEIRENRAALARIIADYDRRAEAIARAGGFTQDDEGGQQ